MHGEAANVVGVGLKGRHFFARVVVEHAEMEVVGATHEPVAPGDEAHTAHGHLSHLERFDDGLRESAGAGTAEQGTHARVDVVDDHVARVETRAGRSVEPSRDGRTSCAALWDGSRPT